jgi:aryl-alcohol dehydrogenase-like predicted oxidoreductase
LAGGLLSGKYAAPGASGRRAAPGAFPPVAPERGAALVAVLRRVADLERVTCAQAALGWILGKPFVASAVLGARTPAQLAELLDARPLSPRAAALLDRASEISFRP